MSESEQAAPTASDAVQTEHAPEPPVDELTAAKNYFEERVRAATEPPKEQEPVKEPEQAAPADKPKEPANDKPKDAGLEKTWNNVLRIDRENRELKKELKELRSLAEEHKEVTERLQDYKNAAEFMEKFTKDPYGVLINMKVDPDKLKSRLANGGKPTVEERVDAVESTIQDRQQKEEEASAAKALETYKNDISEVISKLPKHLEGKITVDDCLELSSVYYSQNSVIMDVDDVVTATIKAKDLALDPPKPVVPAPAPQPRKPVEDPMRAEAGNVRGERENETEDQLVQRVQREWAARFNG
jgi:hypothetical protein